MKPITEKMTNPENMLVPLLMHEMMKASLTNAHPHQPSFASDVKSQHSVLSQDSLEIHFGCLSLGLVGGVSVLVLTSLS